MIWWMVLREKDACWLGNWLGFIWMSNDKYTLESNIRNRSTVYGYPHFILEEIHGGPACNFSRRLDITVRYLGGQFVIKQSKTGLCTLTCTLAHTCMERHAHSHPGAPPHTHTQGMQEMLSTKQHVICVTHELTHKASVSNKSLI